MTTRSPPADNAVYVDMSDLMSQEAWAQGLSFSGHQPVGSILAGQHGSKVRGRGLDFDTLRQYLPGDDLRQLDWRASLRFNKPYVRTYLEEKDRTAWVVVDQRMSMFFGSTLYFKSVVAARLAALAAWMAYRAGDRVGGIVIGDSGIESVKPQRSRARIQQLCGAIVKRNRELSAIKRAEDADGRLNDALRTALAVTSHNGLIIIVSDFAGANDDTVRLLRGLAAHNDIVAVLVFDPMAANLPSTGQVVVTQGELQLDIRLGRRVVHQPLRAFFSERLAHVDALLKRARLPLLAISTADDTVLQLRRELGRQGKGLRR